MHYNWFFSEAIKHTINVFREIFHSARAIRRWRRRSRLSSGAGFRCLYDDFFVCIHSPGMSVFQTREWGEKNKTKKRTTNELKIPRHVVSWEITAVSFPHAPRTTRSVGGGFFFMYFISELCFYLGHILYVTYGIPARSKRTTRVHGN